MVDVNSLRGSPDDQEVNVDDSDELRHWTSTLKTTPEKLKEAVVKVGRSVALVRDYLSK